MATPDDLKDTSAPDKTDNAYYIVTVDDLTPGEDYKFQFAWIYPDKRATLEEDWSVTKTVTASTEVQPNPPKFTSQNLTSDSGLLLVSWDGVDNTTPTGLPYKGVDRVEVFISGGSFDSSKPVTSFKVAGKKPIAVAAGTYTVTLKAVTVLGTYSDPSDSQTETVSAIGFEVEDPTAPNGFSSRRILAGIEVSWAGTYASGDFKGFEAIKIFAGTSSSATSGTYTEVGVLTGNKVKNTIVVPVDGTYVKYDQATYIHAASVNAIGTVGAIQANVTNQLNGPGKATDADINDGAIVIDKLASNVLTVGNLKAGDISSTSYIRAGTAGSARVEISSSQIGSVRAGLHIYSSVVGADPILAAPLTGGLTITGDIVGSSFSSPNGDISIQPDILNTGIDIITIGDGTLADFSGLLSFTSSEQGGITIGFGSTTVSGGTTSGLSNHIQIEDGEVGDYNTAGPSVTLGSSTGSTFSGLRNIQPILSVLLSGYGIADNASVGSTSGFTEGDVVLAY